MKLNISTISLALAAMSAAALASCEDQPDKFELTSGKPTIKYVRVPDPEKRRLTTDIGLYGQSDLPGGRKPHLHQEDDV